MTKGFTLIEVLIIVAVSALMASVAIVYTHTGESQLAISVEAQKIAQYILQAKALAIATYGGTGSSCAYGVYFNLTAQTYSVFAYDPAGSPPCPSAKNINAISTSTISQYSQGTWNVKLPQSVMMTDGGGNDSAAVVLFYPPAPTVFFLDNGVNGIVRTTSKVYLQTADGTASRVITINPAGQVSL